MQSIASNPDAAFVWLPSRRTPWQADYAIPTDVGRVETFVPYTAFASPAIIYETVFENGGRLIQFAGALDAGQLS